MAKTPPEHPAQQITPEEEQLFLSLRAHEWDEFIGQDTVKESLQIAISAAKARSDALDHTLLYGPPGLGKTTLSYLIAQEMGTNIKITSGTALTKVGDIAAILTNLQPGDVLFIDEIHRLPKSVEETLYPVMEDYALDIVIGKGPSARTLRLDIPHFTLVGATTRYGLLAGPFRDRFGLIHRLNYYEPEVLVNIVLSSAKKMNLELSYENALEVARRARGTPRIALKLLKRVRDFSEVKKQKGNDPEIVHKALNMFSIDTLGLEEPDRRFLEQIITKHKGGPVGLSTIAAMLNEDSVTIEEVIEPYLMQVGFLQRTSQGRVVTPKAYEHLKITFSEVK